MSQKTKVNKFLAGAVTATMVATAVVPTAALAAKPSEGFSDVGHLAPETLAELDRVVELGLMTGFGNAGLFKPETYMNRGQVAKALAKYEAGKSGMSIAQYYHALKLDGKVQPFADVPKNSSDQELYQASLIVKNAGTFKGVSNKLNPDSNITRGHMASVLVRAFDLKATGKATDFADKGDADTEEIATNMQILKDNGVAKELSDNKFNPNQNVKRIQMASFLLRAYDVENPEVPAGSGITSVKAINDTRYEVTFNKAFDKDVAREIEKEPSRIIAFDGAQNANSSNVIKAETVTFDSANKVATVTFDETPQTDINYTVALMDNKENTAATVVAKSSPQVLVKGAETPSVDVNAEQDKVIIDFKQKMDKEALDIAKYTLYDDKGNKLGDLSDYAKVSADKVDNNWVDATSKKAVEFELLPEGKLEAGKTYKIVVSEDVRTDDGYKLAENKRTVNFKTPSVSQARPEIKFATVKDDKVVVHFDKDLDEDANLIKLVKVKTATGTELKIEDIDIQGKKVEIDIAETLDKDSAYTVELPENVVANAYFYNSLNKAGSVKAKSVEDKAVTSMKAAFEKDSKSTRKANLVLSFDREVKDELKDIEIRVDGKTYKLQDSADVTYGKTHSELKIKDIETAFEDLQLEDGKTYEIVAKAGAVKTDSTNEPTNKEELKATITSSISVAAPRVKRMELVSAEEIVVEFDQTIDGKIDADDVSVQNYYIIDRNGFTELETTGINDDNYIKVSVSGKKVTIKTAAKDVKFATGSDQEVVFDANAFKGSNGVENLKVTVKKDADEQVTSDFAFVDNASPEIVGAQVKAANTVEITYSENLDNEVTEDKDFASQFTFEGLENRNYGSTKATVNKENKVTIEFDKDAIENAKDAFEVDKNYPNAKIKYAPKTGKEVKDNASNKAKSQTWTGISK